MKLLKWGMACCMLVSVVAWQTKDTSFQPIDTNGFIAEMQKQFAEVQAIRKKDNHREELDRKMRDTHRMLMHTYPVYYDWWLQDGQDAKNEKDGKDVNWFRGTLSRQLSMRLQKLNVTTTVNDTPESITAAFQAYLKACEARRAKRLASFTANSPEIVFTKFRTLRPSFFAYTEGASDARAECNYIAGGTLSKIKMNGIWAEEETLMTDEDGVYRDPNLHFDGQHLLFSWKKSAKEDDFHLYEMDLKTRDIKQLTFGKGHADIEGIYLPDENILFNSTRCGSAVDCWFTEVSNMYLCDREGRYMRQVGFDQVHTVTPTLLDDGRIVYTRWDYNDRGQVWAQPLFQMNPDGTGQAEYYGMNSWFPTTVAQTRQIPGTRKVMTVFMGHHTPQHGKLGIIDPEAGRDENEGTMFVAPLRKPEAERIDSYGQFTDQYQHPFPMNETDFLISYTPLGYYVGHPMEFGIYWMNVDGERELLVSDSKISCNQPILVAPRTRPFQRSSSVDYTKNDGVYYMQNIYEGNGLKGVKPGTIKQLRVVEIQFRAAGIGEVNGDDKGGGALASSPVGVGNAAWDVKRVIGVTDVYPDGSAFFKVPARRPLYFQALDENGRVVQTMRSWSTLQPNEVQSCVGCHEHKNTVPVAGHPVSMAMNKGIKALIPEDEMGERNFSYLKEIQPIWDKHCISCHDGVKQPMSLKGELQVLDKRSKRKYAQSYLSLTHARMDGPDGPWRGNAHHPEVNWISALSEPTLLPPYFAGSNTSNLIKRLEEGHGGTKLTPQEIRKVSLWIDLLVPQIGDYREANNWSQHDLEYYDCYDKKRKAARAEEQENIRQYIQSLQTKQQK